MKKLGFVLSLLTVMTSVACVENNFPTATAVTADEAPTYMIAPSAIQWLGLQTGSSYVMPAITFYAPAGVYPNVQVSSDVDGIDPAFTLNCERSAVPTDNRQVCQIGIIVYARAVGDAFITIGASQRPAGSTKFRVSVYPFGGKGNLGVGAFIPPA